MDIRTAICSVVALLMSSSVSAQTADEIQQRVKDGQKVSVTDSEGREFSGRVVGKTNSALTIVKGQRRSEISYDRITSIDRPKDSIWNGAVFGLLVGAGVGFAAAEGVNLCDAPTCPPSDGIGLGIVIGSGIGALVGSGIDALMRRERNIYRRPGTARVDVVPTFAGRRGGLALSVAW
jgi:hypothetical protein